MNLNDSESLRQALIEVDHLRQREAKAQRHTAELVEGLKLLSLAGSAEEGLGSVLAVLGNAIDYTAGLMVAEAADGRVASLAATDAQLAFSAGVATGPLRRALDGSIVTLSDATRTGFWDDLTPGTFSGFGSAILAPAGTPEAPAAIVCLHAEKAAFDESACEVLRQFQPLAVQAIRHVTKLDELADAVRNLESARDQALSADRAKSEFIASISHEMRTPMNGILGMIELMSHTPLEPSQREKLHILRSSGMALFDLIESVLDVSSLELRAARIEKMPFDPHITARQVIDGLLFPAEEKGLALRLSIAPNVPQDAFGDEKRIAQVIRNLIANAIKYTDNGWIDLRISVLQEAALKVEVVDTGRGFLESSKADIFEKFVRGEQHRKDSPGLGLGLSICKEIIELMDGQIGVASQASGGSCFWFILPGVFAKSTIIRRSASLSG